MCRSGLAMRSIQLCSAPGTMLLITDSSAQDLLYRDRRNTHHSCIQCKNQPVFKWHAGFWGYSSQKESNTMTSINPIYIKGALIQQWYQRLGFSFRCLIPSHALVYLFSLSSFIPNSIMMTAHIILMIWFYIITLYAECARNVNTLSAVIQWNYDRIKISYSKMCIRYWYPLYCTFDIIFVVKIIFNKRKNNQIWSLQLTGVI